MRYCDITQANRFRLPASHPILAGSPSIPAKWYDLQRLDADNPDTQHRRPRRSRGRLMTVYLACSSDEVSTACEDGWG